MGGHAGILAGENAALIRHILPEQGGVLEVERVCGKINLRFGARRAGFHGTGTALLFIGVGFSGHNYLISR